MENIKKQVKFQFLDTKKPFLIFWGIVILINILSYITNFYFDSVNIGIHINNQYAVVSSNYVSIGIFLMVVGIIMYTETFNAAMEFGSTRKDYYSGSIIFYASISLAMVIVQTVLLKIEEILVGIAGVSIYQGDGFNSIKLFFTFLLICSAANLFGVIFYKWGYWIWAFITVGTLAFITVGFLREGIVYLFITIFASSTPLFSLYLTILSAIFFLAGWLLVRKVDVKNRP